MATRRESHLILGVEYFNRALPQVEIEPMSLSDLLSRKPPSHFAVPQRPGFHLLFLVSRGRGGHYVDFERIDCRPGTIIHVRPQQVQQFDLERTLEAQVLLFTTSFVLPDRVPLDLASSGPLIDDVIPSGALDLDESECAHISAVFDSIARVYSRTDGSLLSVRILQHLLHALLLQLAGISTKTAPVSDVADSYRRLHRRFVLELDRRLVRSRRVQDYAEWLGCSVRTLSRACLAACGLPPKAVIERRVMLESKRLLAHTNLSVETVAGELGFSEATNFVKFFRHFERMRPTDFRARYPGFRNGR